jgi:hypothetical protein
MRRFRTSVLLTGTTLVLCACGAESTAGAPKAVAVDTSMAELVPADAVAFFHVPSLDAVQQALDLVRVSLPSLPPVRVLHDFASELDVNAEAIDPTRPAAMAAWIDAGSQEARGVMLLPAKDPKALAAGSPGAVVRGTYVAIPEPGSTYVAGGRPHPLATASAASVLDARFDLARLIDAYRPMIEDGIGQFESEMNAAMQATMPLNPAAIFASYAGAARSMMDSAEELRVTVQLGEESWDASFALTAREGSPMATLDLGKPGDVAALARYVDLDATLVVLAQLDFARVSEMFSGLLQAAFPGSGYFERFGEVYPLYGGAMAGSLDFSGAGLQFAAVYETDDGEALVEKQLEIMTGAGAEIFGASWEAQGVEEVDGLELHRVGLSFGPEAPGLSPEEAADARDETQAGMAMMFGEQGLSYALGAGDARMLMLMGGDSAARARAVKRFRSGGADVPPDLARALRGVRSADAAMILRVDLARLMVRLAETFGGLFDGGAPKEIPPAARSASAPLSLSFAVSGRTWSLSASIQPKDLAKLEEVLGGF